MIVSTPEPYMQLRYLETRESDFDELAELRIDAMRESLERLGRFDRERSIERFRSSFVAEDTTRILKGEELVGFFAVSAREDHLYLGHLYVKPGCQGTGIGTQAFELVHMRASQVGLPIRLGALKESRSNEFYQKLGFEQIGEEEWDIYYQRFPDREL